MLKLTELSADFEQHQRICSAKIYKLEQAYSQIDEMAPRGVVETSVQALDQKWHMQMQALRVQQVQPLAS